MTPEEQKAFIKARSLRNWAIFAALAIFVVIVFAVTITRMGGDVYTRPL